MRPNETIRIGAESGRFEEEHADKLAHCHTLAISYQISNPSALSKSRVHLHTILLVWHLPRVRLRFQVYRTPMVS